MNEPTGLFNVRKIVSLLYAVSIAAGATAPIASLATCALPGCHDHPRSGTGAQARGIDSDPGESSLKNYSGIYQQSVSNSSELRTFAMAAAAAKNPYADDVERMGYARGSMYSGMGAGSVSSLRSARRADGGRSAAGLLPGVQGLSVGISGAVPRISR